MTDAGASTPWHEQRFVHYDGQGPDLQFEESRVTIWGAVLLASFFAAVTYFTLIGGI